MSRLLPICVALLPLVVAPGLALNYDVIPRLALFEVLCCAALACTGDWLPGIRPVWSSTHGRFFLLLTACSAIWSAVCTFTSVDRSISIFGSTWRELGLITWLSVLAFAVVAAASMVHKPALTATVLRAVALSGIVGACYGILQYFGIDPILPSGAYHAGESEFTIVRTPGTLGHADYFAAWLVAVFFLALPLARRESGRWRWLGVTAQATSAIAILLSGTRAALLALIVGVVVALALLRPRMHWKQGVAFLAPVLLGVVFYLSPAGAPVRARVHWSLDDARGGARLLLWRDSLRMIAARPLQGFGPETYSFAFPHFQSVELARQYPDWYHESPHNALLDAATSEGLPALALAVALFGVGLASAWTLRSTDAVVSAALFGALTAQFVNLQFVALTLTGAVFLLLTVAISMASAVPRQTVAFALPRWRWAPAFLAALLFGIYAVRLLAADIVLARFDGEIQRGQTTAAISAWHSAQRWSPSGRAGDLYCSRGLFAAARNATGLFEKLGAAQAAIAAGARAVKTADDRQNAWYNLAMLSAAEGDRSGVERCLREAIAASPNWFRPHWALARLLSTAGRPAEARVEAATAVRLNGGHDPQVAASLHSGLETISAR